MPSGKTHDAITILLAVPTHAATYVVTEDLWLSSVVFCGFIFGGLMFGPDLDTGSTQYGRWSIFRFFWFPYRTFFKHRSRWSHGFVFGTVLRLVYFMGVVSCVAFLTAYFYTAYRGGELPGISDLARVWAQLRVYSDRLLGELGLAGLFFGMWLGAASHTLTDIAGTYVKTGKARL